MNMSTTKKRYRSDSHRQAAEWNEKHPPGSVVRRYYDVDDFKLVRTKSEAWVLKVYGPKVARGEVVVLLEDFAGNYIHIDKLGPA